MLVKLLQLLSVAWLTSEVASAHQDLLGVHGSGTTNPSKCYWSVIDKIQSQSALPTRIGYRAVGSTTGQEELINNYTALGSVVDFASGDIPIFTEDYEKLKANNIEVVQLPVLLGAVSVFHSVPDTPDLNLTGCLLAEIYTRAITDWSDPKIKQRNPNLKLPASGLAINVGVRLKGSSSTESFAKVRYSATLFSLLLYNNIRPQILVFRISLAYLRPFAPLPSFLRTVPSQRLSRFVPRRLGFGPAGLAGTVRALPGQFRDDGLYLGDPRYHRVHR